MLYKSLLSHITSQKLTTKEITYNGVQILLIGINKQHHCSIILQNQKSGKLGVGSWGCADHQ